MSICEFITPAESLKATFKEFVAQGLNKKETIRAGAVYDYLCGVGLPTLSETYHIKESTIREWIKKVDAEGWTALKIRRKRTAETAETVEINLTEETRRAIDKALQSNPYIYGYNFWDAKTLSDFLEKRFSLKYPPQTCQELMKQLGYALLPVEEAMQYLNNEEITYFHNKVAHFNIAPSTRKRWVKIHDPNIG